MLQEEEGGEFQIDIFHTHSKKAVLLKNQSIKYINVQ